MKIASCCFGMKRSIESALLVHAFTVTIVILDENIRNKVKKHKARQAAGRPKKESPQAVEQPKKEPLLTVEPSVNSVDDVSKV